MVLTESSKNEAAGVERAPIRAAVETISPGRTKPELLAPAGDHTCLIAAVENGADAVYFGLERHNARACAGNFHQADLAEVMALLHGRGVRGYVTLNTLVFTGELAELEDTVRAVAAAGVDAVIVQDLGLARLIRAIAPDLEIHASTQMSVTSALGLALRASWAVLASSWRASSRWRRSGTFGGRSTCRSRCSCTGRSASLTRVSA